MVCLTNMATMDCRYFRCVLTAPELWTLDMCESHCLQFRGAVIKTTHTTAMEQQSTWNTFGICSMIRGCCYGFLSIY